MTNTNTKTKIVYKMDLALELIQRGHEVLITMPNPKKPEFTCWVFSMDSTLERDIQSIVGGGQKDGKR